MPVADCAAADRMRGHMGYRALPAEALEFLSRRRAAVALCRSHDSAYDLVPIAGAFFVYGLLASMRAFQSVLPMACSKL